MFVVILPYFLVALGIVLLLGYFYLIIKIMPRNRDRIRRLGWYAMLLISISFLLFFSSWMLWEPLARVFLPIFVVISLFIGFLFRTSAISPYQLARFWGNIEKKLRDKKDESR